MLTGMGADGLRGAHAIAAAGGSIMAQDEATSVVWGMPGQVAHAGLCSAVLPLDEIGAQADAAVCGRTRMTPQDFDYLRKMLQASAPASCCRPRSNIWSKAGCCRSRAGTGSAALAELVAKLKAADAEPLAVEVVEAMTTNETFFFRDKIPFEHFRDTMMPALIAARAREKRIRIWCTAASTGQEPYSLAMSLKGMGARLAGWRVEILATDLSGEVLERAKAGIYSQFEVQRGLPIQLLVKYFTQVGENWQIAPEMRAMVQFRPLNLLNDFTPLGAFDLVFCRNVLIYFDQPTKTGVLDRLARQMPADGFLVLGAAETVVGLTDAFKPMPDKRGLYVRNPGAAVAAPASNILKFAAKA